VKKLVTTQLGLKLNERLAKLTLSRLEYGYSDDLMLSFSVRTKTGGMMVAATEEKFAACHGHPKNQAEVGIFGTSDPTEAVRLLVQTYPKATILMRKDPKRVR
jgi:hypothetical protein